MLNEQAHLFLVLWRTNAGYAKCSPDAGVDYRYQRYGVRPGNRTGTALAMLLNRLTA